MRTLLAALICLMLFATPVVAGDLEDGIAGMPTAFIGSYGSGEPIIGFLAEYDALPGVSQDAVPERQPRPGVDAGHGCGHNLYSTASTAAAIAVAPP
mgnify:CR=1 FL=1